MCALEMAQKMARRYLMTAHARERGSRWAPAVIVLMAAFVSAGAGRSRHKATFGSGEASLDRVPLALGLNLHLSIDAILCDSWA